VVQLLELQRGSGGGGGGGGGGVAGARSEQMQLVYFISDGVITQEKRAQCKKWVRRAAASNMLLVMVVLDAKRSILEQQRVTFNAAGQMGMVRALSLPLSLSRGGGAEGGALFAPTAAQRRGQWALLRCVRAAPSLPALLSSSPPLHEPRRPRRSNPLSRSPSCPPRLAQVRFLDDYPFPYYVVIRDLAALPETLADALRQWIELIRGTSSS
jgi:hypothetical protein